MKVLQLHNEYLFPGGEDGVAAFEADLLRSRGHEVIIYRKTNRDVAALSRLRRLGFVFRDAFFSKQVYGELRAIIRAQAPDVAHVHNSFLMLGPAAYRACFDAGVPVVQTLHNFRFLCAAGTFFRNGHICEECLSCGPWRGILHGCWQGSRFSTAFLTMLIRQYRVQRILERIRLFVALSQFSRDKHARAGWDPRRIVIKPNACFPSGRRVGGPGRHVLYAGALQPYKGLSTLLKAWAGRRWPVPLKIVGSGPEEASLRGMNVGQVEFLGQKVPAEVADLVKEAVCVVLPSECYENFPRIVIEAYTCGVPVIASRLGSIPEIVRDGETGWLFKPGDADDLASRLSEAVQYPDRAWFLGQHSYSVYLRDYSPERNIAQLMEIYERASS